MRGDKVKQLVAVDSCNSLKGQHAEFSLFFLSTCTKEKSIYHRYLDPLY